MMSEMRSYSTEQTINPTVSTQGFEDGEPLNVRVRLLNSDEQELGKKETHTNVQNHQASYSFRVKELAQELHIDPNKVAFVKCWIDADDDGIVDYNEEITARISTCFCNRDFTVDEVRNIVKSIRDNTFYDGNTITSYHQDKLFYLYAHVPQADRTFEKFTDVLNNSFKKYGIIKCSHKIHYLANMYVETMYFTATREGRGSSGYRYDPYRGRGFQHLTWRENYQTYSNETGTDIATNYEWVADNLEIAADTGAWYWNKLNINHFAEADSIFDTSRSINLPGARRSSQINGFANREIAWTTLKQIFNYPHTCISN